MQGLLVARLVHFYGFATWLGSLFAAIGVLVFRDKESDPEFRKRIAGSARGAMMSADICATLAIGAGIYMASTVGLWNQPWLHIKLTVVAFVVALHVFLRIAVRRRMGANPPPAKISPALFGILTVLMVAILYLVIFKPIAR